MYLEIAQLHIKAGSESAFEQAASAAVVIFERARGCAGMVLRRSVENPSKYLLFVSWKSLEDHTQHFKSAPDGLQAWRDAVSRFYAETPPTLEHSTVACAGFGQV